MVQNSLIKNKYIYKAITYILQYLKLNGFLFQTIEFNKHKPRWPVVCFKKKKIRKYSVCITIYKEKKLK